jgi:hypothetical protein
MSKKIILAFSLCLSVTIAFCAPDTVQHAPLTPTEHQVTRQNNVANNGQANLPHTPAPAPDSIPRVVNIDVFHASPSDTANTERIEDTDPQAGRRNGKVAYAGNILRFTISHPLAFLKTRPTDQSRVVLYVNGIEMQGITADWYSQVTTVQIQAKHLPAMKDPQVIDIVLARNAASQQSWNFLYNNTKSFTDSYIDIGNVSIGWEKMAPLESEGYNTTLTIAFFYQWKIWGWSLLYLLILVGFLILAICTNVLQVYQGGPYSLSNTQLLFWTALVMGAFIYTLLLTDVSMSFNTSILYLMGISLGTTGVATAIDQNKLSAPNANLKVHDNFIRDLLSDGNSYSVQRIQTFAWNLLLGVYFITYTIANKTMPEFSTTLLLLAGASSAAYLAAKFPENTTTLPNTGTASLTGPAAPTVIQQLKVALATDPGVLPAVAAAAAGPALNGASVQLTLAGSATPLNGSHIATDPDGTFTFNNVVTGYYTITATLTVTPGGAAPVTLKGAVPTGQIQSATAPIPLTIK